MHTVKKCTCCQGTTSSLTLTVRHDRFCPGKSFPEKYEEVIFPRG